MLNGKNWWTQSHNVKFEHKEDYNDKLERAIQRVWDDWYHVDIQYTGLDNFRDAIKQVMSIVNSPSQEG